MTIVAAATATPTLTLDTATLACRNCPATIAENDPAAGEWHDQYPCQDACDPDPDPVCPTCHDEHLLYCSDARSVYRHDR